MSRGEEVMGVEMNKATVRRLIEDVWNQQNLDAVSEVFAADGVYHQPNTDDIVGTNSFREFFEYILSSYPDIHFEVKTLFAEGDYVALHWAFDAPGKGVKMEGIDVCRMSDGQIAEIWTVRGD
jgi:predicted SnoaL-like aldol condensation-catalyzing enzyme